RLFATVPDRGLLTFQAGLELCRIHQHLVNGPELFLSPACARLLAIFLLRTGFMLIFEQYLRLKCYKL
ncbi:hypothetical protein, partial [Enterobacter hormaechei]|uniref:hypothetical protein n=3 Tax=Enterobacteriaceae TaxID=543 RepID=UPI001E2ABD5E